MISFQQMFVWLTLHRGSPWFALLYSPVCRKLYYEKCKYFICRHALCVSFRCVSQHIDDTNLHLWTEWLHKYTIWGIKDPAQVKADWQQHCLVRLHFILRSPHWPQALWPWGQCQSLKWDKPAPQTQVTWVSSGEPYLKRLDSASFTTHLHYLHCIVYTHAHTHTCRHRHILWTKQMHTHIKSVRYCINHFMPQHLN